MLHNIGMNFREAVWKTIRYADLFDFVLTEPEIRRFLIEATDRGQQIPSSDHYRRVGEYYFLPGREQLIKIRRRRAAASANKIIRASRIAGWLSLIPGVRLIALTGSVAASNAEADHDIDLLIVTAANRIWSTRAIIFLLTALAGLKRADSANPYHGNQICFNMWLDLDGLKLGEDLYSAYEFCLMKPLVGEEIYLKLWQENNWVSNFLPNYRQQDSTKYLLNPRFLQFTKLIQQLLEWPWLVVSPLAELVARRYSLWRIKRKHRRGYHTNVTISAHQLMFHPLSPRQNILEKMS